MLTNKEIYELGIDKASSLLTETIDEFSEIVIQLSLANEFSEISDLFDEGDSITFSVGDFLNSTDKNVQCIIKILNVLKDFQDLLDDK